MKKETLIQIRIGRRGVTVIAVLLVLAVAFLVLPGKLQAQKVQESFKEKFNIARDTGGVGITTSADGKYVYVVGPEGILVSDDFGKTGSWVQTVRLK